MKIRRKLEIYVVVGGGCDGGWVSRDMEGGEKDDKR